MEVLAGAASVVSILSLSLQVCGTARELSDLFGSIKDAPKEAEDIRKQIEFMVQLTEEIRVVLDRNCADLENPTLIYNALQLCNDRIKALKLSLPQSTIAGGTFNRWTRTKFALGKPKFMDLKRQISDALQAVDLAMSLCTMKVQLRQNTLLLSALEHHSKISTSESTPECNAAVAISQGINHRSNTMTASLCPSSSITTVTSHRMLCRRHIGWPPFGLGYFKWYTIIEITSSKRTTRSAEKASINEETMTRYRIVPSFLTFALELEHQWSSNLNSFNLRAISVMSPAVQSRVKNAIRLGDRQELQRMLSDRVLSIHDVDASGLSLFDMATTHGFVGHELRTNKETAMCLVNQDVAILHLDLIVFLADIGCGVKLDNIRDTMAHFCLYDGLCGNIDVVNQTVRHLFSTMDCWDVSPRDLGIYHYLAHDMKGLLEYLLSYYGDGVANHLCMLELADLAMENYTWAWSNRSTSAATTDLVAMRTSIQSLINSVKQRIRGSPAHVHDALFRRFLVPGYSFSLDRMTKLPLWEVEDILTVRLSVLWECDINFADQLISKPYRGTEEQHSRDAVYTTFVAIEDSWIWNDFGVLYSVYWADGVPVVKLIWKDDPNVENQALFREFWMLTRPIDISTKNFWTEFQNGSWNDIDFRDWKRDVTRRATRDWPFKVALQHIVPHGLVDATREAFASYQNLNQTRFQCRQAKKAEKEAEKLGMWRKPGRRMPGEWVG